MGVPRFHIGLSDRLQIRFDSIQVGRWRFVEGAADRAARRFLAELSDYLNEVDSRVSAGPLYMFRNDFRRLLAHEPIAGLVHCAARETGEQRRLAIWLLGRTGSHLGISVVANQRSDPDVRIQRHVARALLRMEGWQHLRNLSAVENDAVVRRIAATAERPPRPFPERVGRFLARDVQPRTSPGDSMHTDRKVYVTTRIGGGLPPRSPEFIRAILERIRRLVASSRRAAGRKSGS
jgi:hypothetical protein